MGRVYVVSAWGSECFGIGTATFRTDLPFVIRTISPRYLNLGDLSQYSLELKNRTQENRLVTLAIRPNRLVSVADGGVGYSCSLPPNKRVSINFWIEPERVSPFPLCLSLLP